ncbi:MAG TPA: hypothetical protein VMT54_00290 [Candidatus Cybelea sp.]|nr:hypothetical protein [Candidatus Cybelea sp.]
MTQYQGSKVAPKVGGAKALPDAALEQVSGGGDMRPYTEVSNLLKTKRDTTKDSISNIR